jgi:hypothetical protein
MAGYDLLDLYSLLGRLPVPAGERRWNYSNLGVGLLGQLLAQRTGRPYDALLDEQVVQPLGLHSTWTQVPADARGREVQALVDVEPAGVWDMGALRSAGELRSTARDLARYVEVYLGLVDSPLSASLQATLARRRPMPAGIDPAVKPELPLLQAITWEVIDLPGGEIVDHGGTTGSQQSFVAFDRTRRRGVVVMAASARQVVDPLGLHVIAPETFPRPQLRPAQEMPADALAAFEGRYRVPGNLRYHVWREGGHLRAQVTGRPAFAAYALSPERFFFSMRPGTEIEFRRGEDGAVKELVAFQDGQEIHCARLPPEPAAIALPAAVLGELAGSYELADGLMLMLESRAGGGLQARFDLDPPIPLEASAPRAFFAPDYDLSITVEVEPGASGPRLWLEEAGTRQSVLRRPRPEEPYPVQLSTEELDVFRGRYETPLGVNLDVTRRGGELLMRTADEEWRVLHAHGWGRFARADHLWEIAFEQDEDGAVQGVTLRGRGGELRAARRAGPTDRSSLECRDPISWQLPSPRMTEAGVK